MSFLSPARRLALFGNRLPSRPYGQSGSWNKLFEDEFKGPTLNSSKWVSGSWWSADGTGTISTNNEREVYRPSQIQQSGNKLDLVAAPEVSTYYDKEYIWKSGQIISGPTPWSDPPHPSARFATTYGYFEARVKLPKGKGLWPAFWLLPADTDVEWPHGGEIDIMEFLGPMPGVIHHHFHYFNGGHVDSGGSYDPVSPADFSLGWHVLGVDWTPDYIKWFVDGVESRAAFTNAAFIPNQPMYIILGLAVGGNWLDELAGGAPGSGAGDPDGTTPNPAVMSVDWVRVWKRPTAPGAVTANVEALV